MSSFRTLLLAAAAVVTSGSAFAGVITYGGSNALVPDGSISVSLRNTNFAAGTGVTIPKFDTALGTLTSIQFVIGGTVISQIRFENTGTARTVTATSKATETLTRPDTSVLVNNIPLQSVMVSEGSYDHTLDFGGTSGTSLTTANGNAVTATLSTTSAVLTSATDKALFSQAGGGSIFLPVKAVGGSTAAGGGNVTANIKTQASAQVLVQYVYVDAPPVSVPEPATMALLGAGLLAVGAMRRRSS